MSYRTNDRPSPRVIRKHTLRTHGVFNVYGLEDCQAKWSLVRLLVAHVDVGVSDDGHIWRTKDGTVWVKGEYWEDFTESPEYARYVSRTVAVHAIKALWPWHWSTARDTGATIYEVCSCGQRRIRQAKDGFQPIDRGWLATGEWTPRPTRFPAATSGVVKVK